LARERSVRVRQHAAAGFLITGVWIYRLVAQHWPDRGVREPIALPRSPKVHPNA